MSTTEKVEAPLVYKLSAPDAERERRSLKFLVCTWILGVPAQRLGLRRVSVLMIFNARFFLLTHFQ